MPLSILVIKLEITTLLSGKVCSINFFSSSNLLSTILDGSLTAYSMSALDRFNCSIIINMTVSLCFLKIYTTGQAYLQEIKMAPLATGWELTSGKASKHQFSSCVQETVFEGFLRSYILVRYFYLLDTFQFSDRLKPDGTENLTISHLKVWLITN